MLANVPIAPPGLVASITNSILRDSGDQTKALFAAIGLVMIIAFFVIRWRRKLRNKG